MTQKIRDAFFKRAEILLRKLVLGQAAVHFQRADSCHHDHSIRDKPRHAAFDIKELFSSEICSEACLGNGIVAELQCHPCGDDRIAAVRDVGKRTAVYKCGGSLKRLHKVRLQRILEQSRHSASRLELTCRNRLIGISVSDNYTRQSLLEVGKRG